MYISSVSISSIFSLFKGLFGIGSIGFCILFSIGGCFYFIKSKILSSLSSKYFDKFIFSSISLFLYSTLLSKLNLSSTKRPGVGSIISLVSFLFSSSAFSIAASKSVLLIVIAVFNYSSFASSYVLIISFPFFKEVEVKRGGGVEGLLSFLAYFLKSSCISNSGGNSKLKSV